MQHMMKASAIDHNNLGTMTHVTLLNVAKWILLQLLIVAVLLCVSRAEYFDGAASNPIALDQQIQNLITKIDEGHRALHILYITNRPLHIHSRSHMRKENQQHWFDSIKLLDLFSAEDAYWLRFYLPLPNGVKRETLDSIFLLSIRERIIRNKIEDCWTKFCLSRSYPLNLKQQLQNMTKFWKYYFIFQQIMIQYSQVWDQCQLVTPSTAISFQYHNEIQNQQNQLDKKLLQLHETNENIKKAQDLSQKKTELTKQTNYDDEMHSTSLAQNTVQQNDSGAEVSFVFISAQKHVKLMCQSYRVTVQTATSLLSHDFHDNFLPSSPEDITSQQIPLHDIGLDIKGLHNALLASKANLESTDFLPIIDQVSHFNTLKNSIVEWVQWYQTAMSNGFQLFTEHCIIYNIRELRLRHTMSVQASKIWELIIENSIVFLAEWTRVYLANIRIVDSTLTEGPDHTQPQLIDTNDETMRICISKVKFVMAKWISLQSALKKWQKKLSSINYILNIIESYQ